MAVVIETTVGDITVDLFTERRPQSEFNFATIVFSTQTKLKLEFGLCDV